MAKRPGHGQAAAPAAPARAPRQTRVIYLGGLGRSGSTLLERLIGQLPGVSAAGEVVHLWRRGILAGERCGCGVAFRSCPFWQQVGEAGFGGWDSVDASRLDRLRETVDRTRFIPRLAVSARLGPAFRGALDEYLGYYERLYAGIADISGCRAIVDSSKHASLAFCLRRSAELDLRVIHVVRDSRAVAYSWTKQVRRPEAPGSFFATYSPAAAAGRWNLQNGAMDLLARTGTPALRVRYEDYAADPESTLRQIAAFAGLPANGADLRFLARDGGGRWAAQLGVAHTGSGNPMRFATGEIKICRDDTWQKALPSLDRAVVSALTLPLLARYGYLPVRAG